MTQAVQVAQYGSNNVGLSFKNRIINGDMRIDQRNAGASVTLTSGAGAYTVDRWIGFEDTDGAVTAQQSSVAPAGFTNSLLCTTTTADTSLGATQFSLIAQRIEGFNIADLGWGTANAQSITLGFWVRSSLTGTFGGSFNNGSFNRYYPFSYIISAANTWEYKTITVAGDTTGTWNTTNGLGLQINFGLGVGSTYSGTAGVWAGSALFSATGATSVVGTSGATFYITGVQLEKGSVATSFDYRPYGTELQLCQRYYQTWGNNGTYEIVCSGYGYLPTSAVMVGQVLATMRSVPTISYSALSHFRVVRMGITAQTPSSITIDTNSSGLNSYGLVVAFPSDVNLQYQMVYLTSNGTTSMRFNLSSEL